MALNPCISVILPVLNGELYIKEAVDSILKQTFYDFELIVVNNASTDNTLNILKSFDDKRIIIITNPETYIVAKSLNIGIANAKGKFIARMDGDDISDPTRFDEQIKLFKKYPNVDWCTTWVKTFGKTNHVSKGYVEHDDIKANMIFLNTIYHPAVMFRKSAFEEHGLIYNENLKVLEDYTLWLDAIEELNVRTVPKVLLNYREHNTNLTGLNNANRLLLDSAHNVVFKRLLNNLNIQPSDDELQIHRQIGIRTVNYTNYQELGQMCEWLKKIYLGNKSTHYYNDRSLKTVIFSSLVFAATQVRWSLKSLLLIFDVARFLGMSGFLTFLKRKILYR